MRACPGVYFADEPADRVAKVAGTGLGVWEIIQEYRAMEENEQELMETLPQITPANLKAALMYYKRYRQEIDSEMAENAALTPEAIEAKYPGLLRKA